MSQNIDFSVQLPLILRVQQMKFDTQKYYKLKISISITCAVIFAVYISNSIIKSSRESCVVANYCIFSLSKASTKNESKFFVICCFWTCWMNGDDKKIASLISRSVLNSTQKFMFKIDHSALVFCAAAACVCEELSLSNDQLLRCCIFVLELVSLNLFHIFL